MKTVSVALTISLRLGSLVTRKASVALPRASSQSQSCWVRRAPLTESLPVTGEGSVGRADIFITSTRSSVLQKCRVFSGVESLTDHRLYLLAQNSLGPLVKGPRAPAIFPAGRQRDFHAQK